MSDYPALEGVLLELADDRGCHISHQRRCFIAVEGRTKGEDRIRGIESASEIRDSATEVFDTRPFFPHIRCVASSALDIYNKELSLTFRY